MLISGQVQSTQKRKIRNALMFVDIILHPSISVLVFLECFINVLTLFFRLLIAGSSFLIVENNLNNLH